MTDEEILAELTGGTTTESGWRPPRSMWERFTDPVKAGFQLGGNIFAQIARPFAPDQYRRAAAQQAEALRVGPESDLITQAMALPDLGNVLEQDAPEGIKPAVRLVGSLANPFNLIPVGRAATAAAKGAGALGLGERVAGRLAAPIGRALAGERGAEIATRAGAAATAFPFTAAAGLVYAPEITEGIGQSGREMVKALQDGDIGLTTKAAASLATQAAVGYMVARGAAGEARAGYQAARRGITFPERAGASGGADELIGPPEFVGPPREPYASPTMQRIQGGPRGAPVFPAQMDLAGAPDAFADDIAYQAPPPGQQPLMPTPEPAPTAQSVQMGRAAAAAPSASGPAPDSVQGLLASTEGIPGVAGAGRGPIAPPRAATPVFPEQGAVVAGPQAEFPVQVAAPEIVIPPTRPPEAPPAAPVPAAPRPPQGPLAPGDAVSHPTRGEGVVTEITPDGIGVRFPNKKQPVIFPADEPLTRLGSAPEAPVVPAEAAPAPAADTLVPPTAPEASAPTIAAPAAQEAAQTILKRLKAEGGRTPTDAEVTVLLAADAPMPVVPGSRRPVQLAAPAAPPGGGDGPPPGRDLDQIAREVAENESLGNLDSPKAPGQLAGTMGITEAEAAQVIAQAKALRAPAESPAVVAQKTGPDGKPLWPAWYRAKVAQIEAELKANPERAAELYGPGAPDVPPPAAAATPPPVEPGPAARRPESPEYPGNVLAAVGDGAPGLSITPVERTVGATPADGYDIVYRDPAGKPVATARVVETGQGPRVMDMAARPGNDLLRGRGVAAVAQELKRRGVTQAAGTMSPDAERLFNRMRPVEVPAAEALIPPVEAPVPRVPDEASVAEGGPVSMPKLDKTGSRTETRAVRRQPWEVPDEPGGQAVHPPPAARMAPKDPEPVRPPIPNDLTPAQMGLIEKNVAHLDKLVERILRDVPGGDSGVAWNAIYKATQTFKPEMGAAFPSWAFRDAKREVVRALAREKAPNANMRMQAGQMRGAATDSVERGATDPALKHIDDSFERTPDMHARLGAAQEALDEGWTLDKNIGPEQTRGAYSAATSGVSYKDFAKSAGISEGAALKVYKSLGARARALWDAAGLPVDASEINIGALRVPASGSNEIGVRAAAYAPEPTDYSLFTRATKDAVPSERWKALTAEDQDAWQRYFQRLRFGFKSGADDGAIQALNNNLAAIGGLNRVDLGTGNLQRQATKMAKEMFGEDLVKKWFSDDGKSEFRRWIEAREKADRVGQSPLWKPSRTPGLQTMPTPDGALTVTIREDSAGRVFEPAAMAWGKKSLAEVPGRDEVIGVLKRLEHAIRAGAIERGDRISFPNALRGEHPQLFDEFKNRFLKPQTYVKQGRMAPGTPGATMYGVRELPGGGPAHPTQPRGYATPNMLGAQTLAELTARGLKEAPAVFSHGATLFATGVRDFASWSARMVQDFGSSITKWLGEIWVRVGDAAERWLERRSERTKDFVAQVFETTPSRFGPSGKIPLPDAKRAVDEAAERFETLNKYRGATHTPNQGERLIAQTARAADEELALGLALDAPKIDLGKVKPGGLLDRGINMARVGEHVPERAKLEEAYLAHVLNPQMDRAITEREAAVIRTAMPMLADGTAGEIIANVQRKLGSNLTYAEAYTIRNLRDILGVKYAEAKALTQQGAVDLAAGKITKAAYEEMLAKAASLEAQTAHAIVTAANVGTYGGRLLRFQQLITQPGETLSFKNRFINSAREGLKIDQKAAEALYQSRMDYAEGRIDQAAYLDNLHAAAKFTTTDKIVEYIKSTYMTLLSPISAATSNTLGVQLARAEARLGAAIAPATRKIFGRGLDLGADQAQHAMPLALENHLRSLSHTENWGHGKEEFGNILFGRPLARPGGESSMSAMGFRQSAGAIEGRKGEIIRSVPKLLHVLDQMGQRTMTYRGLGQHAWNEAVAAAKASGTHMDQAALITDTMKRVERMRDVAEALSATGVDDLAAKYGPEQARALKEQYKTPLQHIAREAESVTAALALDKQPYFTKAAEVGQALSEWAAGKVWGAVFLPFVRTGTNVAIRSTMHTPLGFTQVNKALREGRITPAQWERDVTKPLIGTAVMGAVIPLAMSGDITGSGPDDPKAQQQLRATGWQPYSIRIGDNYFNYQRLEPLASVLSFAADLGEDVQRGTILDEKGDLDLVKLGSRSLGAAKNAALSKTFFTQLESLFAASADPGRYGERFMKQLAGTVVPNGLGLIPVGSLARAMDPVMRQTGIWTAAQAKIPGLAERLPAQISPLGSEIQKPGTMLERLLSPFPRTSLRDDKVSQVARELDRIGYVPSRPPTFQRINGRKIYYTERELGALDAVQLQATENLYRLLNSGSYRSAPDFPDDKRAIAGAKTKEQLVEDFYRKQRSEEVSKLRPAVERRLRAGQLGAPAR